MLDYVSTRSEGHSSGGKDIIRGISAYEENVELVEDDEAEIQDVERA